jgi:predicted acyl esterase
MQFSRLAIRVRDGIQLAADIYMPPTGSGPFPALLEALPYRKDDLTASSHTDDYVRFASEGGFVVCRLDVRGTGSSEGVATDEYPLVELDDLTDVINWLATQPWSNGRVGMFGYSYSGFNSLQVACTRPAALHAICAVYATDDRYTDDVHYMGGALRAIDLVDYCHYMTACNLLPPVPALFGDNWKSEWQMRLNEIQPWILTWLEQQHDGPYWRHGSLRPGYERIQCPTMIVAGWADGYRNNTFRTFEALQCEKSLLIGPWSHSAPAHAHPGPNIDLVPEMISWFNRWLRPDSAVVATEPPIRVFIRHSTKPDADLAMLNGEWRFEETWPPARSVTTTLRPTETHAAQVGTSNIDVLDVRPDVGVAAWNSCAGGLPWGQPTDQREDDSWSLTYDWPVDSDHFEILGHALLKLKVASDQPVASISVKICDVFPDGTSALVTRGFLNLTHRTSSTSPQPLMPNVFENVDVELEATSWVFARGHKIRLSIAGADWPNIWSPPHPFALSVDRSTVQLMLPTVDNYGAGTPKFAPLKPTVHSESPPSEHDVRTQWRIERDVLAHQTIARTQYGGPSVVRDDGATHELYQGEVGVSTTDPTHSWVTATTRYQLDWPEAQCTVEARMRIDSDAEAFNVVIDVDADLDGVEFSRKHYTQRILRRLL